MKIVLSAVASVCFILLAGFVVAVALSQYHSCWDLMPG